MNLDTSWPRLPCCAGRSIHRNRGPQPPKSGPLDCRASPAGATPHLKLSVADALSTEGTTLATRLLKFAETTERRIHALPE